MNGEIYLPAMQPSPPYTLDQLADASGEKARTIRSWIGEGLLPPALGGGRNSYYGQLHMDRLLFIVRLREKTGTRLPLAVVKDTLDRLYDGNDPDVVRRVAHGEESLEVADLFGPSDMVAASSVAEGVSPKFASLSARRPPAPYARKGRRPAADERWTTIQVISDELELRLRSDDPERVAWLARLARRLRSWIQEGEP